MSEANYEAIGAAKNLFHSAANLLAADQLAFLFRVAVGREATENERRSPAMMIDIMWMHEVGMKVK